MVGGEERPQAELDVSGGHEKRRDAAKRFTRGLKRLVTGDETITGLFAMVFLETGRSVGYLTPDLVETPAVTAAEIQRHLAGFQLAQGITHAQMKAIRERIDQLERGILDGSA